MPVVFFLLFAFTAFSWTSCKSKKEKPPVSEAIMKKVIVDLQIAESYSLGLGAAEDSSRKTTRYSKNKDSLYLFYSAILKNHHLTFEEFNDAIGWYKKHPETMDSLLSQSLDELNRQKAKLGITASSAKEPQLDEPETAPGFQKLEIKSRQQDSSDKPTVMHTDTILSKNDTAKNQK